ncbi:MAG: prephenate dehydratase [Deltaproteobacteria bacterium]|nr:prephenate dehydratase [Deltaproteobacteria bacterium]
MEKTRPLLVAFQGERGAYSEQAALAYFGSQADTLAYPGLDRVFESVECSASEYGVVPIENFYAGTIVQTFDLLDRHRLFIVGECMHRVVHALLGPKGSTLSDVKRAFSHPQALGQCETFLREHGIEAVPAFDTAGAAREVSQRGIASEAAIAHATCAKIYGLRVLRRSIQATRRNITRFLVLGREPVRPTGNVKTSLLFETRHLPSALYKALGGFATNGVNLTKIESRPSRRKPMDYRFYLDFEGSPEDKAIKNALRELRFFSKRVRIFGTYLKSTGCSANV